MPVDPDTSLSPAIPPPDLVERFLRALWVERDLAPSSRKAYAYELARLADFLGPAVPLESASEVQLREHLVALHRRGAKTAAVRRATAVLRRYFAWLKRESIRSNNPAERIELPARPLPQPAALGRVRAETLLDARGPDERRELLRDRALLELAYGSGLRLSELLALRQLHLNLKDGVVQVLGSGLKVRVVPLSMTAVNALGEYLASGRPAYVRAECPTDCVFLTRLGGPMTASGFWKHLRSLAKHAGLNPRLVTARTLRHSFAIDQILGGAQLQDLQRLLGHASLETTTPYRRTKG